MGDCLCIGLDCFDRKRTGSENRASIIECIGSGRTAGLLAYRDGEVVGWCNAGPWSQFPMLAEFPEPDAATLGVARGCEDCILFHVAAARRHGASREELVELLSVAVEMGGGPSLVYAAKALTIFDELG